MGVLSSARSSEPSPQRRSALAPSGSGPTAQQGQDQDQNQHLQPPGPEWHPSADNPGATSSSRAGEPGLLGRLIRRASMRRSTGSMATINNFTSAARRRAPPANTGSTSDGASEAVTADAGAAPAPATQADEGYAGRPRHGKSVLHKIKEVPVASSSSPSREQPSAPAKKTKTTRTLSMLSVQPAMGPSTVQSTKLRSKPSFRDRFWATSSSNDFGSDSDKQDAPTPSTPRTAYVPRHAASDFSETAGGRRHRRAVSHDSAVRSTPRTVMPALPEQIDDEKMQQQQRQLHRQQQTRSFDARGRVSGSQYEHMAHRGASFHARASAGAFAYASPQSQYQTQIQPPPVHHQQRPSWQDGLREEAEEVHSEKPLVDLNEKKPHRRPAPPPPVVVEEGPFSDYDRFLASAHAEEMAIRVDAVRRSWREGKRDSACYSGKRGSARTSEDGSGTGDEIAILSPGPVAGPGLRRQNSVAQKIAEYIRPPREEGMGRYEQPASRMGIVREV
ncbi:hypothetical protein ACHAQA_006421 [Verticillium albo-atrum]